MFFYDRNGQGVVTLDLFRLMIDENVNMDHITFVALFTSFSHIGLDDEGEESLQFTESDY